MSQFIKSYDDAMDSTLCQAIIEKFDSQPDIQSQGITGQGVEVDKKNSHDITITKREDWAPLSQQIMNLALAKTAEYVSEFMFLVAGALSPTMRDPETGELFVLNETTFDRIDANQRAALVQRMYRPGHLVVQKYDKGVGGYHHWHSETYPRDANSETLHRVLLFMFYLNDVEVGGETSFYYQDVSISPKAGRMVIAPAYFTHTHKGHIPESNDKYIVTSWIMFQRAEQLYAKQQA